MKKILMTLVALAAFALSVDAQPLEVRARHYRHVIDDRAPGVHKAYDRRRDCMVWRDGRGRFLGEVRNSITIAEKRRLERGPRGPRGPRRDYDRPPRHRHHYNGPAPRHRHHSR